MKEAIQEEDEQTKEKDDKGNKEGLEVSSDEEDGDGNGDGVDEQVQKFIDDSFRTFSK